MQHTACMESARLLRAQADLERATKQYIYIGLSLHQTLSLLILHNRSTTVMELKNEFKVSDKHLWWIKVNALTSKQDWHALEAFAKERKSPIGYVTVTVTFTSASHRTRIASPPPKPTQDGPLPSRPGFSRGTSGLAGVFTRPVGLPHPVRRHQQWSTRKAALLTYPYKLAST